MFAFVGRLVGVNDHSDAAVASSQLRRRNFVGDISPKDAASDPLYENVKGDKFAAEESYFSIRVVEMRLAEAGSYLAHFLPMCCCFLRYTHGSRRREVPFIVGYDMIRAALGNDAPAKGAQNVEFKNIYIVRDAPAKSDGVLMYTALCRVVDSSFARGMIDLLADAAGAVGGPAAGTIARTGADTTKRLGTLLGADGVSTRFGVLDGSALRNSGYRVFAGAGIGALDASALRMEQNQLLRENAEGAKNMVDDVDYLVVALEHRRTLIESAFGTASTLDFHALWEPVKAKLLAGDLDGADKAYKELTLAIAVSPDLIEGDRLGMMTTYRAQAELWKKASTQANSLKAAGDGDVTTRLADMADDKNRQFSKPVASLMKTAGYLIDRQRNQKNIVADAALGSEALTSAARSIRREFDDIGATWDAHALASAQLLSAALSSPL